MLPAHVFTVPNRTMKKPLLTAASVALSFGVLLGCTPASAETITVAGVWDGASFYFYDSRLNDSSHFARFSDHNFTLYTPFVSNPDTDWDFFEYTIFSNPPTLPNEDGDRIENYVFDNKYSLGKNGMVYESVGIYLEVDEFGNRLSYVESRTDGMEGDTYSLLSAFVSALPFGGVGIFDFEQSFIHLSDYSGDYNISLADIMRGSVWEMNCDACNNPENWPRLFQYFAVDNERGYLNVTWNSLLYSPRNVTGMTLAYNLPTIPEPETWAMLLAGLGVVGAVTRRQA